MSYICDHSEDCGGIDSPDPYGFSTQLFSFRNGVRDYLSPPLESVTDFKSQRFALNVGQVGFEEVTKQSFMSLKDWKGDEELDLVLTIISGSNSSQEIDVLLTDRIQLTTVNTYVTPTPVDFQPEEPTPTPTPIQDHDLKSWFRFDSATLNLVDNELIDLRLQDVNVYAIPGFLNKSRQIEIISYSIVKKEFEGTQIDVYENSSSMVYGSSVVLKKTLNETDNLENFEDYMNLTNGYKGEYVLDDFEVNFGIVSANFSNSFAEWRGDDEVLLYVMFGYHDLETGLIVPQLEDKFAIQINSETSEELFGELTPTPDMRTPTPTPFETQNVLDWFSFDSAKINIVNDDFKSVVLENVNINHTAKPDELNKTQDYDLVVWSIVKEVLTTN